jgi:hypothetical protein
MDKLTDISFDTKYSFIVPEDGTTVKPVVASPDEHYWMIETNKPNSILGVYQSGEYTISSNGDKAFGKFDNESTKYTYIVLSEGITKDNVESYYFKLDDYSVEYKEGMGMVIGNISTGTHAWFKVTYPEMVTVNLETNPFNSGDFYINDKPLNSIKVPQGSELKIGVKPKDNYGFLNWTDDSGKIVSEYDFFAYLVNEDVTLTANLENPVYLTIGINDESYGSITCNGAKVNYKEPIPTKPNTIHTLDAKPEDTCKFDGWFDKDGTQISTDNPYKITVTEDVEITGYFSPDK